MTVFFRHLINYVKAGLFVLRQEVVDESREHEMFNPGDVDHFVSAIVPSMILSAINAYPTSLVSETTRAQVNDFRTFRESFKNHARRLHELVINDIARASGGRIPVIRTYRGINKTRSDQIELVVSSIASAAIDAAKNSIENGDAVLSILLEYILRDSNEYSICSWIAKETINLLHALVIEEFEEKGLNVPFDGEKITEKLKKRIWQYHPSLANCVCDDTLNIRKSFELSIQPIGRVIYISEKAFLLNENS